MLRRKLAQLARQLAAEAGPAWQGPSTSGRQAVGELRQSGQRWHSSSRQGSASFGAPARPHLAAAAAAAAEAQPAQRSLGRRVRALLRDYRQLSKARLSLLVVSTAAAGYVAGSGEALDWAGLGWTSLGTMMCASAANALNQAYEVANDARMKRTALRPLPSGRMGMPHALAFAALAGVGGVALLSQKANNVAAGLGAANIALYAGVYTPLKVLSVANTWVGAVVGAVPPLMGWAAAAGHLDIGSALLAAGLYFWQMPHFMALAWLCRADYAAGGYRMLSLVDASGKRTAACALRNCAYLFPLGMLATWLGVTTPYFAYESAFITAGMTLTAAKFYSSPSNANARLLFRASLLHLPIFMVAFLLHRRPNNAADSKAERLRMNVRLLGLGEPVEPPEHHAPGAAALGAGYAGRGMGHMGLPPLPFMPLPYAACPSKAICQEEEEGGEEGAGGGEEPGAHATEP